MRIGVFTDPHYALADRLLRTRRPILSLDKVQRICRRFKEEQVDVILCLGDWISVYGSEEEMTDRLAEMGEAVKEAGVPVYTCMGNHDREIFTKERFAQITGAVLAPGTFEKEGKKLILLDANFKRDGSDWPDHYLDWTQTCVPEEQVEWLKEELEGANQPEKSEESTCLVALHQVLDPQVSGEHVVENTEQLREMLIRSGKVKLVLQGHYHFGSEYQEGGVRFLTLNAVCEEETEPSYVFEF